MLRFRFPLLSALVLAVVMPAALTARPLVSGTPAATPLLLRVLAAIRPG